uniref:Helitron helicase-like domain-containing protein n=1 Tax=Caenorhabditis japonica TaxID=281687 RepID=A0A8R1E586_CAEJA
MTRKKELMKEQAMREQNSCEDTATEYPKPANLGTRTKQCPFCNALHFESETDLKICQKGKVYIPAMKLMPAEIAELFAPRFKAQRLSVNQIFALASVGHKRIEAARGGVQAVKINGAMTARHSALHAHENTEPQYANFVVLECDQGEVVEKRIQFLHNPSQDMKELIEKAQEFLNEHNVLYKSFKNMTEMEKQMVEDIRDEEGPDEESSNRLQFRYVSVSEYNQRDVEEFGKLDHHKGVYVNPAQMGDGYIVVGYRWNDNDLTVIPKGLTVYPMNPKGKAQFPITPFSEMVHHMCYVIFYPFGHGGWQWEKYPRIADVKQIRSYEERKCDQMNEIWQRGEAPTDYFTDADEFAAAKSLAPRGSTSGDSADDEPVEEIAEDSQEREDGQEYDDGEAGEEEDELEDTNNEFNVNRILAEGELEDAQETPMDLSQIGEMPNIRMVERGGEMYAVRDPAAKTIRIPLKSDNPFGDHEGDAVLDQLRELVIDDGEVEAVEEEEFYRNRFDDGTDNYEYVDQSIQDEEEEEHDGFEPEVFPRQVVNAIGDAVARDEERGRVTAEIGQQEDEDLDDIPLHIGYGDEHNEERTAVGRHNDGVRVVNVGKRKFVSLAEYATFQRKHRPDQPSRFEGIAGKLGQLVACDDWHRVLVMRTKAVTEHRKEFPMRTTRSKLAELREKQVEEQFDGKKVLGMLVTLPSTFPGTSNYQRELMMGAVTMSANGKSMFCNDVLGAQRKNSANHGKMERDAGHFGKVVWWNYSIEFQARGMPHAHMMICLETAIEHAAQVDAICSGEEVRYYELVKTMMTHFPCEGKPAAYCNVDKKPSWKRCCKGFPKEFTDEKILIENEYPRLKRTADRKFELMRNGQKVYAGSEYVVSHNPYLLLKYACHINVEVISTVKVIKYIFKYIHKGSDRVLLEASKKMAGGDDAMTRWHDVARQHSCQSQHRQGTAPTAANGGGQDDGRRERSGSERQEAGVE